MYCKYNCVCTAAAAAKLLQSCLTQRPHGLQPTRLHHPWDSPGKRTGVGAIAFSGVCTRPGSTIPGILQARGLGWVPLPSPVCALGKQYICVTCFLMVVAFLKWYGTKPVIFLRSVWTSYFTGGQTGILLSCKTFQTRSSMTHLHRLILEVRLLTSKKCTCRNPLEEME